ncbi:DUF4199 domain-containing protein [Runella sp. MFBS21]|uniref:DUF4199 domain-containing protein n=1 Tax=Runella sp. MFBS21 TaxID=3034018 RepID=UPI0023FA3367|nr:DUF4199 domain-containing protein [Runella sp. MFBS21]MDF7817053.1 DUF4199 domain-containing protein [Runella sp. MFBS21]
MKRNVVIFGLVMGSVLCINMVYMVHLCYTNPDFKSNDLVGYAGMVVIFSLIFFGVKNYRDKQLEGLISFGQAFKMGILIATIASIMYVVVWLFYYYLFVPDYLEKYILLVLKETPTADLPAKTKEMENFKEMYKNPFFVVLITFSEVFPVGLVVSLISAFFLKRNNKTAVSQE